MGIELIGKAGDKEFERLALILNALKQECTKVSVKCTPLFETDFINFKLNHAHELLRQRNAPLILINLKPHNIDLEQFLRDYYHFVFKPGPIRVSRSARQTLQGMYHLIPSRSYLFVTLEVSSDEVRSIDRVEIELFNDICPITCSNFETLVDSGMFNKRLPIFKIEKNKFLQTGDLQKPEHFFKDENFHVKHDQPGLLSMANEGRRHSNGRQFIITLANLIPEFDKIHVVFGRVISGFRLLKNLDLTHNAAFIEAGYIKRKRED